MSGHKAGIWYL